jgi:N-acetylglucosamine kinase-like BadF-type ATPase
MTRFGQLAIDAGGSRTRVLVAPVGGVARMFELPSVNPNATGTAADRALHELFTTARAVLGKGPAIGWLASASVDPSQIDEERERVRRLAHQAGIHIRMVLSNDVVPLLWGVPALAGSGVVVVCGTGSCFFGGHGSDQLARAGGCEYVGSDEGGAVDLGLRGLRAAVRALDGRGPATGLVDKLADWAGCLAPELARRLAAAPYPKQRLAELAPVVCHTWLAGDEVAGEIVRAGLSELVLGVRAVCDRLGLAAGFAVAMTGGVLEGCPELYAELVQRLTAELEVRTVNLVTDTPKAVLDALLRLLGPDGRLALPNGLLDHHAWVLQV